MRILKYNVFAALVGAALLSSCAQGGRVEMGNKYAAVARETVQILFQPPLWPAEQIGILEAGSACDSHSLKSRAKKRGCAKNPAVAHESSELMT